MIVIVAAPYIGFPNGTAATSRVTAYARGLAASGHDVSVILLGPSELDASTAINTEVSGVHLGIPFEYTSVSTLKHPSLLTRRWRVVSSMLRARRRIRDLDARDDRGVEAILLYSRSKSTAAFFQRVSRSVGAMYMLDLCEMPYYDMSPGPGRATKQAQFGRTVLSRFDLIIAISRYLADYAGRYLRPGAEVTVLPIMVDTDAYQATAPPPASPRRVTYIGMLNERKDGVATLLDAFSRVASEAPDAVLRLVGDSDDERVSNVPEFRGVAESLGIADRVEFTGQVPRAEIPRHLRESSVLVLARPSSQQADAGFPTKLGEYLASGRPVVITRTSDIGEYLSDGESAYLVPPDDVDALEDGLRRALADPQGAAIVGAVGRRVAEECFDYRVAGRRLDQTVRRMLGKRT